MILKEYIWIFKDELGDFFCDDVVKLGRQITKKRASVGTNPIPNTKIRNSYVCFLSDYWIKEWFNNYFHVANKSAGWNFQFHQYESFQFTEYKKNQYYKWHHDSFLHDKVTRKLSGIITLSDPKDYTGGELEIKTSENKIIKIGKQPRGTMMVFPSFLQHRVKPVTSGTRHTLVMWARGENFK
jgi:PKHD-type hydroxylase